MWDGWIQNAQTNQQSASGEIPGSARSTSGPADCVPNSHIDILVDDSQTTHPIIPMFPAGTVPPPAPARYTPRQMRGIRGAVRKIFIFLGIGTGNRARKELVAMIWNLVFNFVQFVVTITLVIFSGFHHSPRDPSISEWKACDKSLGVWDCIWLVKIILDCTMTYWGWRRDRKVRLDQA